MKLPGQEWFAERFVFAAFGVVLGLGLGAAWLVCIALSGLAGLCVARLLVPPAHMRRVVWLSLLLLLGMAAGQWRLFLDDDVALRQIAMQASDCAADATVDCAISGETLAPLEYCGFGSYRIPLRLSSLSLTKGAPIPVQGRRVMLVILQGSENRHLLYVLRRQWGVAVHGDARMRLTRTPGNPGAFDPSMMYLNRHCSDTVECHADDLHILTDGLALHPAALLQRFRAKLGLSLRRYLSEEGAAIANGIALGEVSSLRDKRVRGHDIAGLFRHCGISHLLTVSGLHVGIVSLAFLALSRRLKVPLRRACPVIVLLVCGFVLMVGAKPPTVRAGIMACSILLINAYVDPRPPFAIGIGLALASVVLLLRTPALLTHPSFVLSFMAVISLVVLAPPADRLLRRLSWRQFLMGVCGWCGYTLAAWIWPFLFDLRLVGGCLLLGAVLLQRAAARANTQPMRLPKALRMLVAAQAAVQIGLVIPYSALYFGNYSVAGTVVNMLAIPLSGFLVPSYLAAGLVGMLPGGIGAVLGTVAALPARAFTQILCTTAIIAKGVTPFPLMPLPSSVVLVAYFCVPTLLVLYAHTGRWLRSRLRARVPAALGIFGALLLAWGIADLAYQRMQPARLLIPDMTASARRPTVPHAILLQGHRATLIGRCSDSDMRYMLTPILRAFGLPRVTASAAAPAEFASAAGIVVQKEAHYTLIRQASPARPIMLVPSVADLKALAKQADKTPLPMLDTLILPWHIGASRSHAAFRDSATSLVLVTSPRTVIVCDGAQLENLQAFRNALQEAGPSPSIQTTAETGLLTLRLKGGK